MSIPQPKPAGFFGQPDAGPWESDLAALLAGPARPGPPAVTSPDPGKPPLDLTGGYPSASSSGPPPVHPSVVALEQPPAGAGHAGGYEPFSGEEEPGTHEFGEPDSFLAGGFTRPQASQRPFQPASVPTTSSVPYFLQGLPGALTP